MQQSGSIYILAVEVFHWGNTVVLWRVCFRKKLCNWANASVVVIRRVVQNVLDWFNQDESVAPTGTHPFSFVSRVKITSGLKDSSVKLAGFLCPSVYLQKLLNLYVLCVLSEQQRKKELKLC